LRRRLTLTVSAVLLVGLVYSALALTAVPAYASSSCDCGESYFDAIAYCQNCFHSRNAMVGQFSCQYPFQGEFYFVCSDGSLGAGPFILPCSY
jgi:hypothetical protein